MDINGHFVTDLCNILRGDLNEYLDYDICSRVIINTDILIDHYGISDRYLNSYYSTPTRLLLAHPDKYPDIVIQVFVIIILIRIIIQ